MNRKDFERAVGDTTHAASDLGKEALAQAQAYLQQAQEYLAPRAQDALHQAQDYLAPRAQDALHQAQDYLAPRAQDALHSAQEYLTPIAKDARKKGARLAADALDTLQPRIDDALEKVAPAVDSAYARLAPVIDEARAKVQYDLLPRISDALHDAAETAAKVELPEVPEPRSRRSGWKTFGQFLLAGALLAGVIAALRKFLAPADSGWQAHEPSKPYVPTPTQKLVDDLSGQAREAADAASEWIDEGADKASEVAEDVADTVTEAADDAADAVEEAAEDAADTVAETVSDNTVEGDAAPFAGSPYGEGSYVGAEPPEGFVIKGNERSMKYHVPGNGGYERTIADVWFAHGGAAEKVV